MSLEDVFFPSVVLCNMNILRQSFIMALMKDPNLKSRTNYEELFSLVDEHFIQGIKGNLTEKEELIKKSNIFFYEVNYCRLANFDSLKSLGISYDLSLDQKNVAFVI